jgi:hypothetical protein
MPSLPTIECARSRGVRLTIPANSLARFPGHKNHAGNRPGPLECSLLSHRLAIHSTFMLGCYSTVWRASLAPFARVRQADRVSMSHTRVMDS